MPFRRPVVINNDRYHRRRHNNKIKSSPLDKILDLYDKNIHFLIWQLILVIGALFLLLHFLYIQYVPDFDITSVLGLLALAAVTGFLIVAVFIAAFLYPLVFIFITLNTEKGKTLIAQLRDKKLNISEPAEKFRVENEKGKKNAKSTAKEKTEDTLKEDAGNKTNEKTENAVTKEASKEETKNTVAKEETENTEKKEKKKNSFFEITILLFAPVVVGWIVFLILAVIFSNVEGKSYSYIFLIVLGSVVLTGVFLQGFFTRQQWLPKLTPIETGTYLGNICLCFILYFLTFSIIYNMFRATYVFNNSFLGRYELDIIIFLTFTMTIVVNAVQINWFANQLNSDLRWKILVQIGFGAAILLVLTLLSGNWYMIPGGIMKTYGLGNLNDTEITLTKEGCSAVEQIGIRFISEGEKDTCKILHCKLLSRIGENYVLESDAGKRFAVSKNLVQSHSLGQQKKQFIIDITDFKDSQNKYVRSSGKIYVSQSVKAQKFFLIQRNYCKNGKQSGDSLKLKDFIVDHNTEEYEFSTDPVKTGHVEWCDFELIVDGTKQDFMLKREAKVE